jgi:hypothetical protein
MGASCAACVFGLCTALVLDCSMFLLMFSMLANRVVWRDSQSIEAVYKYALSVLLPLVWGWSCVVVFVCACVCLCICLFV